MRLLAFALSLSLCVVCLCFACGWFSHWCRGGPWSSWLLVGISLLGGYLWYTDAGRQLD